MLKAGFEITKYSCKVKYHNSGILEKFLKPFFPFEKNSHPNNHNKHYDHNKRIAITPCQFRHIPDTYICPEIHPVYSYDKSQGDKNS